MLQVQMSLDRPVFMASEPLRVKLSASVPARELNGVKVHVVQDVQVSPGHARQWSNGIRIAGPP
jgi:hypothetical protein